MSVYTFLIFTGTWETAQRRSVAGLFAAKMLLRGKTLRLCPVMSFSVGKGHVADYCGKIIRLDILAKLFFLPVFKSSICCTFRRLHLVIYVKMIRIC
jgi:hypothetical protein